PSPHAQRLLLSFIIACCPLHFFFFFNDPAPTEIYTLSLHDALPIFQYSNPFFDRWVSSKNARNGSHKTFGRFTVVDKHLFYILADRKSTRLNSSHVKISYAVFCLKKKRSRRRTGSEEQNNR